ncbi:MAG: YtxH domain-containing protein [Acidobacteria bacterium]|nr:YtxH domain-containing protein [Acidobacteriota bacterium]
MANNEGIGAGGLLVAFVAGAVTGAAIALLFAPAAGDETREYLGQRAREGRDRASEAVRKGREVVDRQREHLSTAFERAREQYQQKTGPATAGGEEPEA